MTDITPARLREIARDATIADPYRNVEYADALRCAAKGIADYKAALEFAEAREEAALRKIAALSAALKWALSDGVRGEITRAGKLSLTGGGCGCCGDYVTPPDGLEPVIRSVLEGGA
jgi:hypothetical protein